MNIMELEDLVKKVHTAQNIDELSQIAKILENNGYSDISLPTQDVKAGKDFLEEFINNQIDAVLPTEL